MKPEMKPTWTDREEAGLLSRVVRDRRLPLARILPVTDLPVHVKHGFCLSPCVRMTGLSPLQGLLPAGGTERENRARQFGSR